MESFNMYRDHLVHLVIKLPTRLTVEQVELIKELCLHRERYSWHLSLGQTSPGSASDRRKIILRSKTLLRIQPVVKSLPVMKKYTPWPSQLKGGPG